MKTNIVIKKISNIQQCLQILKNWSIEYDNQSEYKDCCNINKETRQAIIYGFHSSRMPRQYILHEMLHICQKELETGSYAEQREKEEQYIHDLCNLVGAVSKMCVNLLKSKT